MKTFEKPYCALHACTYTLPARFLYTAQQLSSSCLRTFAQWQILIISSENYKLCLPSNLVKLYGFQEIPYMFLRIFFMFSLYCSAVELFLSLYICTMADFAKVCPQMGKTFSVLIFKLGECPVLGRGVKNIRPTISPLKGKSWLLNHVRYLRN